MKTDIDLSGPLCRFFSGQAERLTGDPNILEVKHVVPQVLCMRTRGQLTVGILSDLPILQAKAGAQVSEEIIEEAKRRWEREPEQYVPDEIKELAENEWLLHLFFDRDNKTQIPSWSFASMRKMAHQGYDLIKEKTLKRINLDFDWKRELAQPETQMAGQVISE